MSTTQVRDVQFSFLRVSQQEQCQATNTSGQSQENGDDGQDAVTRVPRRTPMACTFCRGRKLKCDGQPTCANCHRRGLVCEYVPV
ncbi:hypothetical protein FOMPIDRAFT_1125431 [Fomitopsis schrenkii]|uniref:Zn(2)-C6 fungal-type domain-containing protein n=1 Tax=Fomitopsis schrenkii TaxID=2126942 RepID=S8FBD5_FOMSC|nr:hypothetical protein FOMPIDRAFT_1125431 [Fomitopsis schrenkii]